MFDGEIWKSSYGTNDADGELPQSVETDLPISQVDQTYEVSRLARVWLPAAYEPMAISSEDGKVDWDPDSSTLIVDKDETTSDGLTYQVTSDVPKWQEAELRTAPAEVSRGGPRPLPRPARRLQPRGARSWPSRWSAGAATPYDQALALQDYLKVGDFTYDLNVPGGHSEDALSTFLFDTKRGYCEQFAGSMAAMARAVGLPSRVAVGFTPGIQGDDGRLPRAGRARPRLGRGLHAGLRVDPLRPDPGPGAARRASSGWATPSSRTSPAATARRRPAPSRPRSPCRPRRRASRPRPRATPGPATTTAWP